MDREEKLKLLELPIFYIEKELILKDQDMMQGAKDILQIRNFFSEEEIVFIGWASASAIRNRTAHKMIKINDKQYRIIDNEKSDIITLKRSYTKSYIIPARKLLLFYEYQKILENKKGI